MSINVRTRLDCDGDECPVYLWENISREAMARNARNEGWLFSKGRHFCPDCRKSGAHISQALDGWNTRAALSALTPEPTFEWWGDIPSKLLLTLNGGTLEFGHVHQVDARSSYDRLMGPPCVGNWHIHINHVRGIDIRNAFATEAEARAALEQAARQWLNLPPIKEG